MSKFKYFPNKEEGRKAMLDITLRGDWDLWNLASITKYSWCCYKGIIDSYTGAGKTNYTWRFGR